MEEIVNENLKIRLEPFKMDYAGEYFREFNEDITKFQWPDPFENEESARELLKTFMDEMLSGETLLYAIVSDGGEFLGSTEVHGLNESCPEIGVWVKKSQWKKSYAYAALKATLDFVREHHGKKEFFYEADVRNAGSMKLLGKFENEYEIIERELEKLKTDSGKELELKGFIMRHR